MAKETSGSNILIDDEEDRVMSLHSWLKVCSGKHVVYGIFNDRYSVCECGRVITDTDSIIERITNSTDFMACVRRSIPWRVFKRTCKVYDINVKEWTDI